MADRPFKTHSIAIENPDKTIKGLILPGPHANSIPETWTEYLEKIFVIYYTPGVPRDSNLFVYDPQGKLLWRAPSGGVGEIWGDAYVEFVWSEELGHLGAALYSGGGRIFDEETGAILDVWSSR